MWLRLSADVRRKRLLWLSVLLLCIGLISVVVWVLSQYPRQVLLSDVRKSKRIIVVWHLPEKNNTYSFHAFELGESHRAEFIHTLTENLGLDYFRSEATVAPMIDIYLGNDAGKVLASYGIRRARGGGPCPSMDSLRNIAAKGRRLSEKEVADIFKDNRRSKWPHILPWPECRYDYVLPVTARDTANVPENGTE